MPCALTRTRKQRSRSRHGPASRVGFIALSKGLAENWSQLLSCSSIREGMLDKRRHHSKHSVLTIHPKFSLFQHKMCDGKLLLIELVRARVSDMPF